MWRITVLSLESPVKQDFRVLYYNVESGISIYTVKQDFYVSRYSVVSGISGQPEEDFCASYYSVESGTSIE